MLAQYWVKSLKELGESYKDFESSSNYKALLRFGDERLKAELTNYINQAKSIWKYISIVVLMFISTIIVTLVLPRLVNISEGVIGLILMLILGSFYNYLCLSKLNESINKALNIRLYKCYFAIFLISLFIIPQFSVIILFWILLFHGLSSFLVKEYYLLKNPFIPNENLTEFSNEVLTSKDILKIFFTNNSNRCSKDEFVVRTSLFVIISIIIVVSVMLLLVLLTFLIRGI